MLDASPITATLDLLLIFVAFLDDIVEIDTNVISSKFILYACALATVIIAIFADKIIRLCQLVAYYM